MLFHVQGPVRKIGGEKKVARTYEIISPVQTRQSELIPLLQYVGLCYQALSWADLYIKSGIFNVETAGLAMSYGNLASIQFFFKNYVKILDHFLEPFPNFYNVNSIIVLGSLHKTPGCLYAALLCFYAAGFHMKKYCEAFSKKGKKLTLEDDQEQKTAHLYASYSQKYLDEARKNLPKSSIECWNIYAKKPQQLWENFFYSSLLNTDLQEDKSTDQLIDRLSLNMSKFYKTKMHLIGETPPRFQKNVSFQAIT